MTERMWDGYSDACNLTKKAYSRCTSAFVAEFFFLRGIDIWPKRVNFAIEIGGADPLNIPK